MALFLSPCAMINIIVFSRLIPTSRSYPFHLQLIRSLIHLTKHTETFISLTPYLVPIVSSTLSPSSRPKSSTLRPLDLEVSIRTPQQYLKTRVYLDGVLEEAVYLLTDWLASPNVQGSIAYPEIIIPIVVSLRKTFKNNRSNGSGKDYTLVKTFLERVEESSNWVEERRRGLMFSPGHLDEIQIWESKLRSSIGESPLGKYLKVQKKAREKRRELMRKVRHDSTLVNHILTVVCDPIFLGSRR
jgi:nucleolar complex protein 2